MLHEDKDRMFHGKFDPIFDYAEEIMAISDEDLEILKAMPKAMLKSHFSNKTISRFAWVLRKSERSDFYDCGIEFDAFNERIEDALTEAKEGN